MSEDASYELQVALVATMINNAALAGLVGNRIYDRVPRDKTGKVTAEFPFVSLGPEQEIPENADCIRASEFILQIDVWSREVGFKEAKRIAGAIEDALHEAELPLADNAFVYLEYDGRQTLRDPDGLTSHVAMTFRAGVDKL